MTDQRYVIRKIIGSQYARIIDTHTGEVIRSVNVMNGSGWNRADNIRDALNRKHNDGKIERRDDDGTADDASNAGINL